MAVGGWQSFPKVELFAAALCELVIKFFLKP